MQSLLRHKAAVIWGGPGDGKTSTGMEVASRLWEAGSCRGGCFVVDLNGTSALLCALASALLCAFASALFALMQCTCLHDQSKPDLTSM